MNYEKQYLLAEATRFFKEHKRSPKVVEWNKPNNYPTLWYVRKEFGSWIKFLNEAGLELNTQVKKKYIICEICGSKFTTTRINRTICDSQKCRYIRDSIYHVRILKERYECSAFHFIPENKLIDYFSCLYKVKKANLPMIGVI